MPPPPPPLMDELVEEVLLRLPPDSPASLVCAGLVCKRWCRLVTDPAFWRRYIDFHGRAPPPAVLGFLMYYRGATRFVPTSGAGALHPHGDELCGLRAIDSRHGRVLLRETAAGSQQQRERPIRMVVWNPITGEQLKLPEPPRWKWKPYEWTAAVLCAAAATAGGSSCDHLDCSGGPFIVVLVGTVTNYTQNLVCIYDSAAGAWSDEPTYAPRPNNDVDYVDTSVHSTLVGNTLYFVLMGSSENFLDQNAYRNILEYNLGTSRVSVVKLPRASDSMFRRDREPFFEPVQLTTTEDGRLGFVRIEFYYFPTLCLWSRRTEVEDDHGPARRWKIIKTIPLVHLLPHLEAYRFECPRYLLGSAEGVGTIFLKFKDDIFTADLRSRQVTKVYTHHQDSRLSAVVPYVNFCTPRTRRIQF